MSVPIVNGWTIRRLLDLVDLPSGLVDPVDERYRDLPLIAPNHIESGTGRLLGIQTAKEQGATSGKFIFQAGDVLYSKIRPHLKKAILASRGGLCSADMYPLRPRRDVDPGWILAVLLGDEFSRFAVAASGRTGIPKINREELGAFEVSTPPYAEQQGIAATLKAVEDAIAAGDAVAAQLRDVRGALAEHLLRGALPAAGRTVAAPTGWRLARLEDLSDFITKGTTPTTLGFEWQASGVRFLRSECISEGGTLQLEGSQFISMEAHVALARSSIEGGDILLSITGYVGKVCRYPATMPEANINQHIARIRIRADAGADPAFVLQVLRAEAFRRYFQRIVTGQAYPQISLRQVRETLIALPALEEQRRIADGLGAVDDAMAANSSRLVACSAVRRALGNALLTGKVRVSAREAA